MEFLGVADGELVVVSLLVVIPLAYSDHLPVFHWNDVILVRATPLHMPHAIEAPTDTLNR